MKETEEKHHPRLYILHTVDQLYATEATIGVLNTRIMRTAQNHSFPCLQAPPTRLPLRPRSPFDSLTPTNDAADLLCKKIAVIPTEFMETPGNGPHQ